MSFHEAAFDDATLTKLAIFDRYLREWLPVFVASAEPKFSEVHIFDFCAGPGKDGIGTHGSPLRILSCLSEYAKEAEGKFQGWNRVKIHAHFFDADTEKIHQLSDTVTTGCLAPQGVKLDIRPIPFDKAFTENEGLFQNPNAAKLLIIDQFGVDMVDDDIFKKLISFPRSDFLFFISSSTLHRFRDHPAIKQKIRPISDPHHVHLAATDYFRELIPNKTEYFLAPFSIRKKTNIYGIIFGGGHPLAMAKFLEIAWNLAPDNGTANFDINREGNGAGPVLPGLEEHLTVLGAFEASVKKAIIDGQCQNERELIRMCFSNGMTLQKSTKALVELKKSGYITSTWRTPQTDNWNNPRTIDSAKG